MKRVTYISKFSPGISDDDIQAIKSASDKNNQQYNITGVLLVFNGMFYQVIEGDSSAIDLTIRRIKRDPRHQDMYILQTEKGVERQYNQWELRNIGQETEEEPLFQPIRNLLDSLANTHHVLEKFAPQPILQGLQEGQNPLEWKFKKSEKVVLFFDLVASTTFTEVLSLNEMAELLEFFYGIANNKIFLTGGTISKLTGDGLMAYYSAEEADMALAAAVEIMKDLYFFREHNADNVKRFVYAGCGISAGPVIKGNIGSIEKMDYTLLGDVVNSAARLESITRKTGQTMTIPHRFKSMLSDMFTDVKRIGYYRPKGKSQQLQIYSVDDEMLKFGLDPAEIKKLILAENAKPAVLTA